MSDTEINVKILPSYVIVVAFINKSRLFVLSPSLVVILASPSTFPIVCWLFNIVFTVPQYLHACACPHPKGDLVELTHPIASPNLNPNISLPLS